MAVNITDPMEVIRVIKNNLGLTFWLFEDDTGNPAWADYDCEVGIPLNFIIDQDGQVQYWSAGFNEAEIREKLEELLPEVDVQNASLGKVKAMIR
jgi:hypothetical protein